MSDVVSVKEKLSGSYVVSNKKENQCIDYKIGNLITQYEMKQLSEADRLLFEKHLSECGTCQAEVQAMKPFIPFLNRNKEMMIKVLDEDGVTLESEKNDLVKSLGEKTESILHSFLYSSLNSMPQLSKTQLIERVESFKNYFKCTSTIPKKMIC